LVFYSIFRTNWLYHAIGVGDAGLGGKTNISYNKTIQQACAAEIAVLYAALTCKQKRYRTSARLTKTRDRCSKVSNNGTGQTDRQSATQYAAPSYGGGPHNKKIINTLA